MSLAGGLVSGCASVGSPVRVSRSTQSQETAIRAQSSGTTLPAGLVSSARRVSFPSQSEIPSHAAADGNTRHYERPAARSAAGGWSGWELPFSAGEDDRKPSVVLSASVETTMDRDAIRAWEDFHTNTPAESATSSQAVDSREPAFYPEQHEPTPESLPAIRLMQPTPIVDGDNSHNLVTQSRVTPVDGFSGTATPTQPRQSTELQQRFPVIGQPLVLGPAPAADPVAAFHPVEAAAGSDLSATHSVTRQPLPLDGDPAESQQPVTLVPPTGLTGGAETQSDAVSGETVAVPDTTTPQQPSMLDRIRELYPTRRDESPAEAIRRPFRRLQSPWSLFAERDVQPEAIPAAPPVTEDEFVASQVPAIPVDADPRAMLQIIIEQLQLQLEEWPRDGANRPTRESEWRRTQTDLRLLHLIADQPGYAASVIPGLPPAEQEFWQSLLLALSYCRDDDISVPRTQRMEEALEHLRLAARRLQVAAELRIRRLTFCNSIHGFGAFDAFPGATFRPGQPVLLYAEIRNFQSRPTPAGTYLTEFSAVLEILRSEDSEVLETIRLPAILDETVSERTDYYQSYELTIPAHLRPGSYLVRLSVQDQTDGRRTESVASFDVR